MNKCPHCKLERGKHWCFAAQKIVGDKMTTLEQQVLEDLMKKYRNALFVISQYKSPEELKEEDLGLPYCEILEMAYENIIFEAMKALNGTF